MVIVGWILYVILLLSPIMSFGFVLMLGGISFGGMLALAKGRDCDMDFYYDTVKEDIKNYIILIIYLVLLGSISFYLLNNADFGINFRSYGIQIGGKF
ncbi:MAG: hypothetical protein ACRCTZ_16105 [Sarcina sp.]